MAILPYSVGDGLPFCDWLDLTFPKNYSDELDDVLRPHFLGVGGVLECPGQWRIPRLVNRGPSVGLVAAPGAGCVAKLSTFGSVYRVSLSGGVPSTLRAAEAFGGLLADLSPFPHRVTRLDCTVDLPIPGPSSCAAVLAAGRAGGLSLGRKALPPATVHFYDSLDARGAVTGSVYLGPKTARIRGVVYDKRHHLEGLGFGDVGALTRVELRVRDVGATLRDACLPDAVFWNYASALVAPPANAPSWTAGGEGFDLPEAAPPDYWRILQRRVDDWTPHLLELAALADKLGPYGRRVLYGLLGKAMGLTPADALSAAPAEALGIAA